MLRRRLLTQQGYKYFDLIPDPGPITTLLQWAAEAGALGATHAYSLPSTPTPLYVLSSRELSYAELDRIHQGHYENLAHEAVWVSNHTEKAINHVPAQ